MQSNESNTRKDIIDKRLSEAGWKVGDVTQVIEEFNINVGLPDGVEEPQTPYQGKRFSDYVLLGKDGKPLAVVEAKKTSVDARLGEEQAKQYAYQIKEQYKCDLPFCFYTNGFDIYFWDLEYYPPRKIYGFPSRADLERLTFIRQNHTPLSQELIKTEIAGRPYQIHAIRSVMEALEDKQRKFLLVMATGTGKTRTTIALIDALLRANWVSRVLFLVDRIALRNQALDAFREHTPHLSTWPKQGEKKWAKDRRVYVSTYPSMLNIIKNDNADISPHFFDFIVVDESHRSIYNVYRDIIDYFNSVVLGLTATPKDVIDHNTFKLFNCEDGLPTFAYSYEEAVNNDPKYLNDFEVLKINTRFQKEGIHKQTISLDDQKKLMAEGIDPEEINFEGSQLEKTVTNKGTNALIVREFMEESLKDPTGVLPGKTIFFCMTKKHARRLKDVFDRLYPQYAGELAKVIVSDDPRVYGKGGLLDQFKNKDFPRVALSVDMLDTGIDVKEIVNLVFAKPVFSFTKFWQMIGRGTRLLDPANIKSWCTSKDKFLIIDCWDNFDYFKLNPKGKEHKEQVALPVRLFKFRVEKVGFALEKDRDDIVVKEVGNLRAMLQQLPEKSVVVMDNKADLMKLQSDTFWNKLSDEKLEFLDSTIAPIMRSIPAVDFQAMRFEKDVVETSIALLNEEKEVLETMEEVLTVQIAELPLTIRVVAKEKELINKALRTSFWKTLDEDKLDMLINHLAPLMRYRQNLLPPGEGETKLDIKDITLRKEVVEFGPEHELVSIKKYREMVEATVKDLATSNLILQKLKENKEITEAEIEMLANMLKEREPYVTEKLLRKVYDHKKAHFIQFIKHILGIERLESFSDSVAKAFEQYIAEHNDLGSKQIQFLEILRSFMIDKGDVEKKDLIQAPFTQIHPDGILGVFQPKEIDEIVLLMKKLVA